MIKAKLIGFGVERDLLTVSTSNFMKTSFIGKPKTGIKECFTSVSFVAEMYDYDVLGAMGANRFKNEKLYYSFRRYKPQEGKIVFCKAGQEDITWFEYNFKDAIPISFHVEFDSQNSMIVTVIISAAMIDYRFFPNKTKWDEKSPTRYVDFNWQESYIEPKETTPHNPTEDTATRVKCYYTDLEGNKKVEPLTGEEVYLVVESQNLVGDVIDIDLSDNRKDFIYKGELLKDDILKDFKITQNSERVKLRVVKQQKKIS